MDKKKLGTVGAVILAIIGIGLRFSRINARNERRESERIAISKAQSVQSKMAEINTQDFKNTAGAKVIQSIEQQAKSFESKSETSVKYDKYTPVNGIYSLGQIGQTFYVVDVKSQNKIPLDKVTQAKVLVVNDKDKKEQFAIIVGKVNDEWLVFGKEGKQLDNLGNLDITEKTRKIIIENKKMALE